MQKQSLSSFYFRVLSVALIVILLGFILFIHSQWQIDKRYRKYIVDEIESVSVEIESLFESNMTIANQIYWSKQVTPKRIEALKENLQQINTLLLDSILGNLRTYYLGEVNYIINDQALIFNGFDYKISLMEKREEKNRYDEPFISNTHYKNQVLTIDDLCYCRPPIPYESLEFLTQYRHFSFVYSSVINQSLEDHDIDKLSVNYRHMITNESWKLHYWNYLEEVESFTVD